MNNCGILALAEMTKYNDFLRKDYMKNGLLMFFAMMVSMLAGCSESKFYCDRVDPNVQIGTYDSRSVAVAFVGSDVYAKTDGLVMKQWMEEYKAAKMVNDKQKIKELEAKGEDLQEKLHLQGFGTAPVDDILAHIPEQVSEIKQQNNVHSLISKWDTKTLERYKGAKRIDVTLALIEAFGPTEKQKERALGIQKIKPIANQKLHGRIDW